MTVDGGAGGALETAATEVAAGVTTVVDTGIVLVLTNGVPERAGQFVTVGAHEVMVYNDVV